MGRSRFKEWNNWFKENRFARDIVAEAGDVKISLGKETSNRSGRQFIQPTFNDQAKTAQAQIEALARGS